VAIFIKLFSHAVIIAESRAKNFQTRSDQLKFWEEFQLILFLMSCSNLACFGNEVGFSAQLVLGFCRGAQVFFSELPRYQIQRNARPGMQDLVGRKSKIRALMHICDK
jgi:hypothetical protein